jgi:hypothetical protein
MRALSSAVLVSLLMASPALADSPEAPSSGPDIAAMQALGAPASDEQLDGRRGKAVGNVGSASAGAGRPAWFDHPDPTDKDTMGLSDTGFPVSDEVWNQMTEKQKGKPKPPSWVGKGGTPAGWKVPGLAVQGLTAPSGLAQAMQNNAGSPPAWFDHNNAPGVPGLQNSVPTLSNIPGLSGNVPGLNGAH